MQPFHQLTRHGSSSHQPPCLPPGHPLACQFWMWWCWRILQRSTATAPCSRFCNHSFFRLLVPRARCSQRPGNRLCLPSKRFHRHRPSDLGRPSHWCDLQSCQPLQRLTRSDHCHRLRGRGRRRHWDIHRHSPSCQRLAIPFRHAHSGRADRGRLLAAPHHLRPY